MNKLVISRITLLTSYIGLIVILLASTLASGGEHTVGTSMAAPIIIWLFKCLPQGVCVCQDSLSFPKGGAEKPNP